MKAVYKDKIGDHTVIRHIANAAVDSEKTKEKIAPMFTAEMTEKEIEKLYMDNLVYASVGPEAALVDIETAEHLQKKLAGLSANQLLLENGEPIADYRGVEYWEKKSGKWQKGKIENIGITLPAGAVLQDNLLQEQQQEIYELQEVERIAALTEKEKAQEKDSRLHALAREAVMKSEEAELLEKEFDKKAWLLPRKAEIEKKYA